MNLVPEDIDYTQTQILRETWLGGWEKPGGLESRMTDGGGFCCDMTAMTREERGRYEISRARLKAAVISVAEIADGYGFRLRDGAIGSEELVAWIAFEQKCCPFFTLTASEPAGSLILLITGAAGVKDFIRAEFSAIRFE
jgi:hypothetical protein